MHDGGQEAGRLKDVHLTLDAKFLNLQLLPTVREPQNK